MEVTYAIINMPDGSTEEAEVIIWEHEGELLIKYENTNN